jgi:hypothetical protein
LRISFQRYENQFFAGQAGAWKHLLTPEIAKKIDKLLDEIEGSGLTFSDN